MNEEKQDEGFYPASEDVYEATRDFWGSLGDDEEVSKAVNRLHRGTKE